MRALRQIATWWRAVTRPAELNSQIEDELALHIDAYAEDLMRTGVGRDEAMRRARAEFGGVTAQKENCRAAWGTRVWDELSGDLRYAVRRLRNSRGFTAIAIGSLALGMGANTIVFTASKALVLDRLGVPRPEQLRLLELVQGKKGIVHGAWGYFDETASGETLMSSFSYPVYQQIRERNRVLEDVFAFKELWRMTATIDDKAEAVNAEMVSGNYYRDLEVRPVLGRPIVESDAGAAGSGPVALISYGFWSRRFGRSPSVIGKTIEVNSAPLTVIGVNPPEFTGAYATQGSPDIFMPLSMQPIVAPQAGIDLLTDRNFFWVMMMGRLKQGVTPQSAQAAMDVDLSRAIRATMTVGKDDEIPRLLLTDGSRGQNEVGGKFGKSVYVLTALAGMVLLLACANLGNLLLARASSRQREMSVRLALGARRARIMRQILTECLLLSAAGGAAGLAVGYAGRNAIPQLLSASWAPPMVHAHFDWTVFGFTAAVSIACALLFGVVPAWQATRTQVNERLKSNPQTATRRSRNLAGRTLVVVQVALSMLLLVGAGLFVRTLMNLNNTRLGFEPDHLLLFDLALPPARYPDAKATALYRRVEERVRALPGVDGVSPTGVALVSNNRMGQMFDPDDQPRDGNEHQHVAFNRVGQEFFTTFGIPLIAGRGFDARDTETSPKVAVVNQTLARQFYPNGDPIGRRFSAGDPEHPVEMQVVGICGDAKYENLRGNAPATMYVPYWQGDGQEFMWYAVRTEMKPEEIAPSLRAAVASIDKDLPLLDLRTQNEQIEDTTKQEFTFAGLTSGFGVLALVLACIGIYGITAYGVAQRTNEIGVRMALGARPGRVLRMVMREASWLAIAGVGAGLTASVLMGRLIASMLFGLKPYDLPTLAGAAVLLVAVALAASWVPALRAARTDPMTALRHE